MRKSHLIILAAILCALFLSGCSGPQPPLNVIRSALQGIPTYSVVLDDMKEEGTFFKEYFHKYRVITEEGKRGTDWMKVPEKYFQRYLPFLGMTIWVKKDGKEAAAIGPPGYEYVGNSRYGNWRNDSSGRSFWVFYGQYRLMSDLLGPGLLYRNHYNTYRNYRTQNRPYYGPKREYGTKGSLTKRQKPNFYKRATYRNSVRKASFSDRVNQRVGRSRASVRGRSGGWGK